MLSNFNKNESVTYPQDTIDILRLIRSENVGIKTFVNLISLYGSAKEAIYQLPYLAEKGGKKSIKIYSQSEALNEIKLLNNFGAKLVCYKDENYPKLLKHIADFPPILTYYGNIELANMDCVGIVGARNCSLNGIVITEKISSLLKKHNINVVSGLARGIDTAAHKSALPGNTIAIVAGGLDVIYPPENKDLYNKIAETGLIIAEMPLGTVPQSKNFPQRNRIISGISSSVAVVEASLKSGSLITARYALEQNRDVYAVPGFPLDPRSEGANKLIKEGACLLENGYEIVENIQQNKQLVMLNDKCNFNNNSFNVVKVVDESQINQQTRKKLIDALSSTPIEVDLLIQQLELPLPVIQTIILEFELAGKVCRSPGNKIYLNFN